MKEFVDYGGIYSLVVLAAARLHEFMFFASFFAVIGMHGYVQTL